jgi:energy-coupling factor transporter ATP-binding protein EcfA2
MSFDPEKITYFAKTDARGKQQPFGIKAKDRQRHVYVIGKTGMGKSTLLENMAVQDIKNGEGMAFIDPHGSTAETLLDFIPEERVKDVLYFAPFDMDNPISFNIMEDVGPDKRHLVVSGLMSVFEKIWVDAWSARMAYILQNTLLALLEYPDSTLLGVNRMLSDKTYREKVVDNVKDPGVKSFWVDEFAKYNERYMQEAGDAIKNKIGQFTANPVIRNIIGQPHSSFDIRDIMDNKKILIMNLSKGLIGETNANLLGSMLTTRIYLAAMSRADLSPAEMKEMPNFYFYVDEFQSFANSTFANILSEARKYKLNLTIAHQYVEQMEEDVRNAVFGNVGTIVSFRVGPFDAEVLESIFAPEFTATDLVNLGFAQIYLTLMIDGIGSRPFSAVTLPPIEAGQVSCKEMVVRSSQKNFGSPRGEVEEMINKFHEENRTPPKPKKEKPPRKPQGAPQHDRGNQPPFKKKPEKDVNDLRNVLKIITKSSEPQQKRKEAPKPKQTGDLKAALAGVMKESSSPKSVPKPVPKEEDTVSAKNLERMMRVTTQDKPPMT